MTYKQLLQALQDMPPERLNDDVTVWDSGHDVFIPVLSIVQNNPDSLLDTDVLDYEHFVLEVNA